MLVLPWASTAEIAVPGDRATLRWAPASGPVVGYEVFVSRNGRAAALEVGTGGTQVTLSGAPGELISIQVRAFTMPDADAPLVYGPLSAASEPIRFAGTASPETIAILDCPSCGRLDFRLLPTGTAMPSVAHPPQGPWDFVHLGKFIAGNAVQVALRQRPTGLLWIGEYTGSSVLHRASYLAPGMDQVEILGAADFDGDGLDEILGRDLRTGALNFWLVEGDELVRDPSFGTANSSWLLIGILDFDRDGQADLWFTNSQGEIWIHFTEQLTHRDEVGFALSLPGSSAVDVADYDGDGMADVLFRASNGALTMALLRGDPYGPAVEFRPLPYLAGDDLLAPRASADLDGRPGAEIVLQTTRWSSGTLDAIFPASANPAQRQRLTTTASGARLIQLVR